MVCVFVFSRLCSGLWYVKNFSKTFTQGTQEKKVLIGERKLHFTIFLTIKISQMLSGEILEEWGTKTENKI